VHRLPFPAVALAAVACLCVLADVRVSGSAADLRGAAARWLETYDQALAAVVATEKCSQRVRSKEPANLSEASSTRALESEFAWVAVLGGRDVVGVRAVRLVDGRAVGEAGRLDALLRAPAPEREAQVAGLLAESVRLLQVPSAVNFNFPTFALGYLRPENAERAKWSVRDGPTPATAELRFRETGRTLVRTPEGRPIRADGSLVVDRATGRVVASRVELSDARTFNGPPPSVETVLYQAHVRYADEPRLGLPVPATMEDRYEWRLRAQENPVLSMHLIIEGRSTYSDYRRFGTDARIVPE
jgi:hypothetical protein